MSPELEALQATDALLEKHIEGLYVLRNGYPYNYLPTDAITQAAFGALCGARRYIERLTREHCTGGREVIQHTQLTPPVPDTP